jgi:hypothetical protein
MNPLRFAAAILSLVESEDDDDDYRMSHHRPPGPDIGIPFHDLTVSLPDDVYTHPHYYGWGPPRRDDDEHQEAQWESFQKALRARGNPEQRVAIYRALPAQFIGQGIRPGDWVTPSLKYAMIHARQFDSDQDWPVLRTVVLAKHLHTDGDSISEWGYNGPDVRLGAAVFTGGKHQRVRRGKGGVYVHAPYKPRARKVVESEDSRPDPLHGMIVRAAGRQSTTDEAHSIFGQMRDADGWKAPVWPRDRVEGSSVWRGMTADEYEATVAQGQGVKSRGDFSHSSEGTQFSSHPADAEDYANFGRTDPRKTGRSTYCVEVDREGLRLKKADGYYETEVGASVPHHRIKRIWRFDPEGQDICAYRIPVPEGQED